MHYPIQPLQQPTFTQRLILSRCARQHCFFFSRNIGYVTLKIIYFHYLKKYLLDLSIQKKSNLILKTEALLISDLFVRLNLLFSDAFYLQVLFFLEEN